MKEYPMVALVELLLKMQAEQKDQNLEPGENTEWFTAEDGTKIRFQRYTMIMDYKKLKAKLVLPDDFQAPEELKFDDLIAKPLTRDDLQADIEGVNSSLEIIRKTRGGSWPEEAVSEEFDFLDLAWHEREFRDATSFAYIIYDTDGTHIGCFYLYPMGERTELTEALLAYDINASWWVTQEAYDKDYYKKLQTALAGWLKDEFPFDNIYYSNKEQ